MGDPFRPASAVRLTPGQKAMAARIFELMRPCDECGEDAMSVKFQQGRRGASAIAQCDECGAWRV